MGRNGRLTRTGRDELLVPDDAGIAALLEVEMSAGAAAVDRVPFEEAAAEVIGAPGEAAPDPAAPDAAVAGAGVSVVVSSSPQ